MHVIHTKDLVLYVVMLLPSVLCVAMVTTTLFCNDANSYILSLSGTTSSNPFWNLITNLIKKPSKELIECQKPKPILLATGEVRLESVMEG